MCYSFIHSFTQRKVQLSPSSGGLLRNDNEDYELEQYPQMTSQTAFAHKTCLSHSA